MEARFDRHFELAATVLLAIAAVATQRMGRPTTLRRRRPSMVAWPASL